ncbi:hypothetical protein RI367_004945 [Sorochytrium milnesiophthora]
MSSSSSSSVVSKCECFKSHNNGDPSLCQLRQQRAAADTQALHDQSAVSALPSTDAENEDEELRLAPANLLRLAQNDDIRNTLSTDSRLRDLLTLVDAQAVQGDEKKTVQVLQEVLQHNEPFRAFMDQCLALVRDTAQ